MAIKNKAPQKQTNAERGGFYVLRRRIDGRQPLHSFQLCSKTAGDMQRLATLKKKQETGCVGAVVGADTVMTVNRCRQ
jgi:hypothetical protein